MRKKFAWFFCIFMSSLVLLSCSEDNKKGEEPGDGTGGGTPEGDTKTYFETTYSDLYESNGRNNGIIARFETAYGNNSLILNKDYCYILVRKS